MGMMKRWFLIFYIIAGFALFGCAGASGRTPKEDARFKNDIMIDDLNVSGMTVAQAREELNKRVARRLSEQTVTLVLGSEAERIPLSELGVSCDIESALSHAASLRRRGGERAIVCAVLVDRSVLDGRIERYLGNRESPPTDATVSIDPTQALPMTYRSEASGISIDRESLLSSVYDAACLGSAATITVPYEVIPAAVTISTIMEMQSLVSQYQTSFAEAPQNAPNRLFNIEKAAGAINGMVLEPGELFDCNAVLGDRTAENGWKEAPGIRNGKYENEYGGGVCQVSSTLFNAVMMADLTITERHPHSWPMGYVEIGRDATISTGGKNFCFVNSSGAPIYLFMHMDRENATLTASIYGKPLPDGMTIEIESEATGTIESAGEVWMLDETLPFETRVVERQPRDGKTAVTYKIYRALDGSLLRREVVYEDTYRAIDGLVYVSTDLYYP